LLISLFMIELQQQQATAFSVLRTHQHFSSSSSSLCSKPVSSLPTTFGRRLSTSTTTTTTTTALSSTVSKRKPSRVSDPSGPTPEMIEPEMEIIDLETLPENLYNESDHLPNQPWRRGFTDGCEAPIDAPWRRQAEELIEFAVNTVGGRFIDVTWYLTACVVTIDDKQLPPMDLLKDSGPPIEVKNPHYDGPRYYDPDDPTPEDIWTEEDSTRVYYERDDKPEQEMKKNIYAPADAEEGETDEDLGLNPNDDITRGRAKREYREDIMLKEHMDRVLKYDEDQHKVKDLYLEVDRAAISTIAGAILDALEDVEDELRILERHEIVLSSLTGMGWFIDTQKEFDANRGKKVAVHTQDPWESNRVLKGLLVDRNAMDVIINQQGRMVTIPNNFVSCVELKERPKTDDTNEDVVGADEYEYEHEYEEYDDEEEEEEDDDDDD
jgi:ribosome maturation factor RimP